MFKVLERPIGTFTGTIPINFPLFSVSSGRLSADVGLSYNSTGGLKVEELASCVGLGFNLNDGAGRITRIINGAPDESPQGMINNAYAKPSTFHISDVAQMWALGYGLLDLEPDIYLYNFHGRTGRFQVRENGQIVLMSNDPIKISYVLTGAEFGALSYAQWIITDEKGNTYYFGKTKSGGGGSAFKMSAGTNYGPDGTVPTVDSWYLSEVYDANEENSLKYTYISALGGNVTLEGFAMPVSTGGGRDCRAISTFSGGVYATSGAAEMLVSRIDGNSGYATFTTANDLSGRPRLYTINRYDTWGNLQGWYRLNYGEDYAGNRGRLVSFSQFGASGTDSLTHSFDYYPGGPPAPGSMAMDIWGFYNGNLGSLFPNVAITDGLGDAYYDGYGNRTASSFYAMQGVLNQITYPTGGSRTIEYEGNTAVPSGDFFQYHINAVSTNYQQFSEAVSDFQLFGYPAASRFFTVNTHHGITRFNFDFSYYSFGCGYNVKIMIPAYPGDLYGGAEIASLQDVQSGSFLLKNGNYRIDVFIADFATCGPNQLNCTWPEGTALSEYPVGGIRVKSVTDYDPVSGKSYTTSYSYQKYASDSTRTSGVLSCPVDITAIENTNDCYCSYRKIFSRSAYPLAAEGGSYVVYTEVRTTESGNGWRDQLFSYVPDFITYAFPLTPPADYAFSRGSLLEDKVYDQSGKLLKKSVNDYYWKSFGGQLGLRVKPYWGFSRDDIDGLYWSDTRPEAAPICQDLVRDCIADMAVVSEYATSGGYALPGTSIDSVFADNGTYVTKTVREYYERGSALIPKITRTFVNGNQSREQTYKYSFTPDIDFSLGLTTAEVTMKNLLLNKNILALLEIADSVKTAGVSPVYVGAAKYNFNNTGSKIYQTKFRTYRNSSDAAVETNFNSYDAYGNIQEAARANDANDVYLWGYKGVYPVVKVTGSNLATVAGFVNASVLDQPPGDAALRTELQKIRTGLAGSNALVTTFTYSTISGAMTSMTTPDGKTEYYEYDAFGRLLQVRDENGNVLRRNSYQIKRQ
ncbi:RHS repeat domain-containing protein [Chitinophaga sp. sic0106]|uniref:RHS repeat domain-containing protein n=1 Tax=Chitinophaga sp. sic0106 TaxID=2854785 RepID=UPI001C440190|nr:RHS repeat domain-containing protein [Chitinophaga sp. sic0106]MBV7533438.1 RHS repeat protein [Chitinophaga sp. sic0106]